MSRYIDGFVLPLPKNKVEEYRTIAQKAAQVFKEHGALEYVECILEDPDARDMVPFPKLANAEPGETVAFSWIVYESREHRDKVNRKIMADPRMEEMMQGENAFDYTKMAYGGFTIIVRE